MAQDFRHLFCTHHGCSEAQYLRRALRECLYPGARVVLTLLGPAGPALFAADCVFLERLGKAASLRSALDRVADYRSDTVVYRSFLRTHLKLRASSTRAEGMVYTIFERAECRQEAAK